jgi:electron transport complex protein RnfG
MNSLKNSLISALLLGGFAVLGSLLVSSTHELTAEQIAANEREYLLETLHVLVSPDSHDNDIYNDVIELHAPLLANKNRTVLAYRARQAGQPYAVVLTPIAPDGYSGDIKLMVAIRYDGQLLGVRVLNHKETPGLGDKIEAQRSDWILGFNGRSLGDPVEDKWKVRKDGGVFDQLTGATISPRAVVKAVKNSLLYFQQHREQLFAQEATGGEHE